MKLIDLLGKEPDPRPLWGGAYKIPWDDPEFSERMLNEHLSQDHDLASRKATTISSHADWIHCEILNKKPSQVLDLGCGPGFYSERLATLGHTCHGLDFSPASIEYARRNSSHPESCEYVLGDIRTVEYGAEYDLAMIIYGEFNAFPPADAEAILAKMYAALKPGGQILIEAHTFDMVRKIGEAENSWYRSESGLFSDRPHICLMENRWHETEKAAHSRFIVVDAERADVSIYDNTLQAYTSEEYHTLVQDAGFSSVEVLPDLGKSTIETTDPFVLLHAVKV